MVQDWRLIIDGDLPAATNMAVDEAILVEFLTGNVPPTLRLYGWERPSISVGCFQDIQSGGIDLEYCESMGIDIVRRSTGGRAVVHGHDLTFSITVGLDTLPSESRSVISSHTLLMSGIVHGLNSLGIPAIIGPEEKRSQEKSVGADCFAHIAECDVRVGRAKIAGAAQVRRSGALMEQGSLPMRESEISPLLLFPKQRHVPLPIHQTLLGLALPDLQTAIINGFQESLNIKLHQEALTSHESANTAALEKSRYHNTDWTYARTAH